VATEDTGSCGATKTVFLSHTSELRRLPVDRSFVDAAESAVIQAEDMPLDMARFTANPRPPAHACRVADPEGRNRTIILWREADLVDGTMVRRGVLTLDATMITGTLLTRA
jgi:hypothetical protein